MALTPSPHSRAAPSVAGISNINYSPGITVLQKSVDIPVYGTVGAQCFECKI
jgi:hypothetical protein